MMPLNVWYFVFVIGVTLSSEDTDNDPPDRQEKMLFDVVKFRNDPCIGDDPFGRIGTCYSRRECRLKNGTAVSQCAQGYGVCCIFELDCGSKISENITHFTKSVSEGSSMTGKCEAKVCRVTDRVCQLRLDFSTFVLAGPSTDTRTTHYTSFGSVVGHSAPSRIAQTSIGQCKRDRFTVRPSVGINVPTLCGINTGQHIYVDISDPDVECSTLAFNFKDQEMTRQWNITIIQVPCDYENRAPPGCLQYHFGVNENGTGGIIQSFNFDGGYHLADQDQFVCIRREANYCSICYAQVDNVNFQDFGISSGKRRVCTYNGSQQTCGGDQTAGGTLIRYFDDKGSKRITRPLDGKSINSQRAETLETNTGFIRGSFGNCGGYGLMGNGADFDYINVNKPVIVPDERVNFGGIIATASQLANGAKFGTDGLAPLQFGLEPDHLDRGAISNVQCGNGNICGRNTSGPGVCSRSHPFNLRFVTDSTEAEFEHLSATPNNRLGDLPHGSKGFRFGYSQRKCSKKPCFQCSLLQYIFGEFNPAPFGIGTLNFGEALVNLEYSCNGPHFTKNNGGVRAKLPFEKVYQPYNGPTIPCDLPIYMEPNDVGTIKFPSDRDSGGMYGPNMNCYFKIIVSSGKRVKIVFKDFNLQPGVDYGITNFPAYSDKYLFEKIRCMSPTDVERESCAHCPNPNNGNDDWCTGGNSCRLKPFFTGFNFDGLQSKKICVSNNEVTASAWCHGNNDFLQVDQKTMFNYSDHGSAQNRFCGTSLPRIGGIDNNHLYVSEENQLILWLKTNGDTNIGTGFELDWMGYDCPTGSPNLDQGMCVATCPPERSFIDQLTCVTACPVERLIIDQGKTCVASCPATRPNEQGTCVTTCPAERPFIDEGACVAACPTERIIIDQGITCVATCPSFRPNDQGTCVNACPAERPFNVGGTCVTDCPAEKPIIDQGMCVATCQKNRPNDQGTCVTTCPAERPLIFPTACENFIFGGCFFCVAACPAHRPNFLPVLGVFYCWGPCPTPNGDGICIFES